MTLQRRTPLRRSGRIKAKPPRRLSRPGADPAYLAFVRTLRCAVEVELERSTDGLLGDYCERDAVQAHHAGKRPGIGMKAPDSTAIPLCGEHHKDWHGASGYFRGMTKVERRQWADERIVEANAAYELAGGVLK